MMAVGVAGPSAHGQAITSTATALRIACSQLPLVRPQASSVIAAIPMTTGTKTTLAGRPCAGSALSWLSAGFTMRTIRARRRFGADGAGLDDQQALGIDRAAGHLVATFVFGPAHLAGHQDSSPRCAFHHQTSTGTSVPPGGPRPDHRRAPVIGTSCSWPSRRTRAVSGRKAFKARMAAVVWRLARCLNHFRITSVMTTAEASKYRCGVPCAASPDIRYRLRPKPAEVPSATSRSML